jgi:hypothetical protein
MEILGYGEDGLTLAFFCNSLGGFLERLGDGSDSNNCFVYYRASFGRGGGFGEIDAIVVTPIKIYLCESKWNDRERSRVQCVQLDQAQVRRNQVFQQIVSAWLEEIPESWEDFCEQHAAGFAGFQLPGVESTLAKNLLSIVNRLQGNERPFEHVLIYFYRSPMLDRQPIIVTNDQGQEIGDYKVVKVKYAHVDSGSHFALASAWAEGSSRSEFTIECAE